MIILNLRNSSSYWFFVPTLERILFNTWLDLDYLSTEKFFRQQLFVYFMVFLHLQLYLDRKQYLYLQWIPQIPYFHCLYFHALLADHLVPYPFRWQILGLEEQEPWII